MKTILTLILSALLSVTAYAQYTPAAVTIGGNQTITGTKTFTAPITVGSGSNAVIISGSAGALNPAILPLPTASSIGGVFANSGSVLHQFMTGIAVNGSRMTAQPDFSDLSGASSVAQLPTIPAIKISGLPNSPLWLLMTFDNTLNKLFECTTADSLTGTMHWTFTGASGGGYQPTSLYPTMAYSNNNPGLRDPNFIRQGGYNWLAYTTNGFNYSNSLGIAVAPNLTDWTYSGSANFSSVQTGTNTNIWCGGWFVDQSGTTHLLADVSTNTLTSGTRAVYQVPVTSNNGVLSGTSANTFGSPVALTTSGTWAFPVNSIQGAIIYVSGTYHYFVNNESPGISRIEHWTSASPFSGYVKDTTGNLETITAPGSGYEGMGNISFDSRSGLYYSTASSIQQPVTEVALTSPDLYTWTLTPFSTTPGFYVPDNAQIVDCSSEPLYSQAVAAITAGKYVQPSAIGVYGTSINQGSLSASGTDNLTYANTSVNSNINTAGTALVDSTAPGWALSLFHGTTADYALIARSGTGSYLLDNKFKVDKSGQLFWSGTTTNQNFRYSMQNFETSGYESTVWCANLLGVNGTRNDTAKNGWAIYLSYGTTGNNIAFQHTNTGGSVAEYLDISGATGAVNNLVGDFIASAVGKTLTVKGGANALSGTFVLSSGTASIATTAVDANTVIACTVKTASGTLGTGTPEIVITSGSGFTATGIATDNSTYNWIGLKANQ